MATMLPDWSTIYKLHQKATEGELYLLRFLDNNLDDTYEVYFNPYLNGDRPDIVVMRKGSGVLIIEVKDWNEKFFRINGDSFIFVKEDKRVEVKSPIAQVMKYKDNLFNIHIENLLKNNIKDSNNWSIINLMTYFHNFSSTNIKNVKRENKTNKYFGVFCKETLESEFKDYFKTIYMSNIILSKYFTDEYYNSFKRYLQPPEHTIKQGIDIKFTKEQSEIINSYKRNQKVLGVAGSGKSLILAQRSVISYERTKSPVLIIFFNITLRNYLHDQLSKVRRDFPWDNFHLMHYHDFLKFEMNNLGIHTSSLYKTTFSKIYPMLVDKNMKITEVSIETLNDSLFKHISKNYTISSWDNSDKEFKKLVADFQEQKSKVWDRALYSNIHIFDNVIEDEKHKLTMYNSILIDEGQDFREEWIRIISNNFLNNDGELVIFADEKQNLYERPVDSEKLPLTPISGPWNKKLSRSFRFSDSFVLLANKYQAKYLSKYELREIEEENKNEVKFYESNIEYYPNSIFNNDLTDSIFNKLKKNNFNPNDVTVLSTSIETLKEFDYQYRNLSKEKTETDFETVEFTKMIIDQFADDKIDYISNKLNSIKEKDYYNKFKKAKEVYKGNLQIALEKIMNKLVFDEKDNKSIDTELPSVENTLLKDDISYKITSKEAHFLINSIEKIRHNKKYHFHLNPGCIKISTVHSFKGWECPIIILLIPKYVSFFEKYEFLYVGLTRAKKRLMIFEEDSSFKEFFTDLINTIGRRND